MLRVEIESDELVIRLDLPTLAMATRYCPALEHFDDERNRFRKVRITDPLVWMREVQCVLNQEAEDGTTLVHRMFDAAFERAIEDGAEGVEIEEEGR